MFRIIEHTADIGIEAHGESIEEAFEEAARGMFHIITDGGKIDSVVEREIEIKREMDMEQLLVDWLSELLYLFDVEHLVFGDFDVKIDDEMLHGVARGEKYSREKHGYGMEIKAVTYHMLEIKRDKKGYIIKVLFDI
ncbi:MAG: archease [Thermoplasmata archaeon]|nr:archease [Thermoplasmata archaeon]